MHKPIRKHFLNMLNMLQQRKFKDEIMCPTDSSPK